MPAVTSRWQSGRTGCLCCKSAGISKASARESLSLAEREQSNITQKKPGHASIRLSLHLTPAVKGRQFSRMHRLYEIYHKRNQILWLYGHVV